MIIRICSFTRAGEELALKLSRSLDRHIFEFRPKDQPLGDWVGESFAGRLPLVFIGASGIAVRAIAPFVKDKLSDSAVVVIDELGQFVIPLLSGHVGGANDLSTELAGVLGAISVITTATDVEGIFAADVFARRNGLHIVNKPAIKSVSARLLRGETIRLLVEDGIVITAGQIPEGLELVRGSRKDIESGCLKSDVVVTIGPGSGPEADDATLKLWTRDLVLGIGCRRGKSMEEISKLLEKHGFTGDRIDIYGIASIDIKAKERGLVALAQYYGLPLLTYTAEELRAVEGDFSESAFVEGITGVSNVCERAAVAAGGIGADLVLKKQVGDGVTLAVARRSPVIHTW